MTDKTFDEELRKILDKSIYWVKTSPTDGYMNIDIDQAIIAIKQAIKDRIGEDLPDTEVADAIVEWANGRRIGYVEAKTEVRKALGIG